MASKIGKKSNLTAAIIFAQEDPAEFKRCTFPILGRPAFSYALMAALNAEEVDAVYVSTASESIIQSMKAFDNVKLIKRDGECATIMEEYKKSLP